MSITIYNYTPPLSTSEQVVADANANNYMLSKYIGIDANGNITKETKTTSDPVAQVQTSAQSNVITTNPVSVLVLDPTNKIATRTNINLNTLAGVFPHCDVSNATGTNYSLASTPVLQQIIGPVQSGTLVDFVAYSNGIVAYNSNDTYKFLVICTMIFQYPTQNFAAIELFKNSGATGIRARIYANSGWDSTITISGIISLIKDDQLRVYASSSSNLNLTMSYMRWTITKI